MINTNHQIFVDTQFKDNSPEKTVAHIKALLASYGIEAVESWHETSVPYCYALSVYIEGTTFSVNGKGLSKEFALASAYGELMERLQLGYIYTPGIQKDGIASYVKSPLVKMPLSRLLEENGNWYSMLTERIKTFTNISMTPQAMLAQFADKDGNMDVLPYYCLTTNSPVYYPNELRGRAYGSNGCAAGNTPEEAIVQAISEIVERNHMVQIIDGGVSLPDIPEEVLKKYETAYRIITYIRKQGNRVIVKDCSLGKKFPVVCLYIIDESTGRYHTHLGAYPIFEIALERSLTESFQGRTIKNVTRFEDFVFKKPGEFLFSSLSNEVIKGSNEKTTSFFLGKPDYEYNADAGFTGRDNKSLLKECIAFFKEQGYDILVRDRSCLGFCTYQVVIPAYSETFLHRLYRPMDEYRYAAKAMKVLRNPSAADMTDLLGYLMHEDQMNQFSGSVHGVHGFLAHSKISARAGAGLENFLLAASKAYIYYALGQQKPIIGCINAMLPQAKTEEADFLICLKRYFSLKEHRYSDDDIWQILRYLHKTVTVEKLLQTLSSKKNPFDEFTLHCDPDNCDGCRLEQCCCQKRVLELSAILNKENARLDFNHFCEEMNILLSK